VSVLRAIFLSLLFHAGLAAIAVLLLSAAPEPTVRVELDLSSVDLSFAEQEAEAPPVQAQAAAPDVPPPKPRVETRPPETPQERPVSRPPEASEPFFPEPQVEISTLVTPPRTETVEEKPPPPPSAPAAPVVAAPAPRQARVDAPPKPRRTIKPVYPEEARKRGEEGDATVELVVGADGHVTEARIVASTGFAALDEAALKAVRAARFTPARAGGKTVSATARLTLRFRLR